MEYPHLLQTAIDTTDCRGSPSSTASCSGLQYRQGDEPPTDGSPDDADWLVLVAANGHRLLAFQQVERLERTTWPEHDVPMQMHVDMTVADREELEWNRARAELLGAKAAPGPHRRRGRAALRAGRPVRPPVLHLRALNAFDHARRATSPAATRRTTPRAAPTPRARRRSRRRRRRPAASPVISRPRISIGCAGVVAMSRSPSSGSTRTRMPPLPLAATAMLPPTMNPSPPNIFFSVSSGLAADQRRGSGRRGLRRTPWRERRTRRRQWLHNGDPTNPEVPMDRRARWIAAAMAAVVLACGLAWWLLRPDDDAPRRLVGGGAAAGGDPNGPGAGSRSRVPASATARRPDPFTPEPDHDRGRRRRRRGGRGGARRPRRDRGAADQQQGRLRVGPRRHPARRVRRGNVLLNTHTWPDGSALGNALLDRLRTGRPDRAARQQRRPALLRGQPRVEVPASEGYPPYYRTDGPPRVAIIVCSGTRSGRGSGATARSGSRGQLSRRRHVGA